jgi:hypothetical protein
LAIVRLRYHVGEKVKNKDGRHQIEIDLSDKLLLYVCIHNDAPAGIPRVQRLRFVMFGKYRHFGDG